MDGVLKKLDDHVEHIKVWFALAGLVLAGALLGVALSSAYYRDALAQERDVNRLMFVDLAAKLDTLAGRLDGTASKQAATANKLEDATSSVTTVVEKVDQAAAKAEVAAKTAAAQAAKVAKAIPPVPPPAAVQPEVVNREIRKANEKLKERAK